MRRVACLVVLAIALMIAIECSGRELLKEYLANPVLVRLSTGQEASGFYVADGTNVFFVTARHVFFDATGTNLLTTACTLLSWPEDLARNDRIVLELQLGTLLVNGHLRCLTNQDIAVARVATTIPSGQFATLNGEVAFVAQSVTNAGGLVTMPLSMFQTFADATEGNEIYLFGYPSSLGMEQVPQIEHDKPLLRKGILAGKNYSKKLLIVDASVYYGNSGGPVIILNRDNLGVIVYSLIGVVSQFVPFEEVWTNDKHGIRNLQLSNSGYAVISSLDDLPALMREMER